MVCGLQAECEKAQFVYCRNILEKKALGTKKLSFEELMSRSQAAEAGA